ncbi:hypothetical protein FRC06_000292 [Ceratobasidium sp. 370]|nr:hypothetical protein FRC06_000292 [Ceratobasidium sp. 370]
MASSDHEMVDLTSPASYSRPPKATALIVATHSYADIASQDAIIIDSSVPTSRASSPPDATSTPTRDRDVFKLDDFLSGHRGPDDTGDTTDHATLDPPTSASVTPQTPTTAAALPTATPASTKPTKPAKSKRRVSRSPSPLPPPPPMLTVRLEWSLPRPGTTEHNEKYAVNVREMARDTGQRHATPVPPTRAPMDSDDDGAKGDTSAVEGAGKEVKRRRRKRREEDSEYDLSDAFIDDSDLQRDSRTHFAQTKQQGFYVSSGEVALVKDKQAPKPRKRAPAAPSKPLSKVATTKAAQSRVASTPTSNLSVSTLAATLPQPMLTSGAPVYKRTPSPPTSSPIPSHAASLPRIATPSNDPGFNPDLSLMSYTSEAGDGTRQSPIALDDARWDRSGHGMISPSDVSGRMGSPGAAGYGIKRQRTETNGAGGSGTVTPIGANGEVKNKKQRKAEGEPFSVEMERLFAELHQEVGTYSWENKAKFPPNLKPRLTQVAAEALRLGEYGENFFNRLPKIFPYNRFTMMDPPMPQKRYRWNDVIKDNVWQQVCLCNEIAALANEAHGFDPNIAQKVSEQSLRKNLYQKIVGVFPEGWLTSNLISREVSEMKRKEKKANDTGEADDDEEPHS